MVLDLRTAVSQVIWKILTWESHACCFHGLCAKRQMSVTELAHCREDTLGYHLFYRYLLMSIDRRQSLVFALTCPSIQKFMYAMCWRRVLISILCEILMNMCKRSRCTLMRYMQAMNCFCATISRSTVCNSSRMQAWSEVLSKGCFLFCLDKQYMSNWAGTLFDFETGIWRFKFKI